METMKAAVLHAPGDLRVESVPVPVPGPGEALIRVGACGVCGSHVPRVRTTGTSPVPDDPRPRDGRHRGEDRPGPRTRRRGRCLAGLFRR